MACGSKSECLLAARCSGRATGDQVTAPRGGHRVFLATQPTEMHQVLARCGLAKEGPRHVHGSLCVRRYIRFTNGLFADSGNECRGDFVCSRGTSILPSRFLCVLTMGISLSRPQASTRRPHDHLSLCIVWGYSLILRAPRGRCARTCAALCNTHPHQA